jgi:cellobiose phosphorylase
VFECEPYAYPQNILGDEHPQFGLARNSWLTGTASWAYQAATQYILGVRPTYSGLQIDPCIPENWHGFRLARRFRGSEYRITVKNPLSVCLGVDSILVNGQEIPGNIIPIMENDQVIHVELALTGNKRR